MEILLRNSRTGQPFLFYHIALKILVVYLHKAFFDLFLFGDKNRNSTRPEAKKSLRVNSPLGISRHLLQQILVPTYWASLKFDASYILRLRLYKVKSHQIKYTDERPNSYRLRPGHYNFLDFLAHIKVKTFFLNVMECDLGSSIMTWRTLCVRQLFILW